MLSMFPCRSIVYRTILVLHVVLIGGFAVNIKLYLRIVTALLARAENRSSLEIYVCMIITSILSLDFKLIV